MAKRRIVKSGTSENTSSTPDSLGGLETGGLGKNVESDGELSPRLNLPLTADGFFALGSMQAKNREKLVKALSDPNLGAALGVSVPTPAQNTSNDGIPVDLVTALWDALSGLSVTWAAKYYPANAAQAIKLSKEESAALAAPTAKIIDKYFPNVLGKYQDEAQLGMMLAMIVSGKLAVLKAAAASGANLAQPSDNHELPLGVN